MDATISAVLGVLAGGALGGLAVRLARASAERAAAARAADEAAGLRARLEERTAHAARLDDALAERARAVEAFRAEAAAARESLAQFLEKRPGMTLAGVGDSLRFMEPSLLNRYLRGEIIPAILLGLLFYTSLFIVRSFMEVAEMSLRHGIPLACHTVQKISPCNKDCLYIC